MTASVGAGDGVDDDRGHADAAVDGEVVDGEHRGGGHTIGLTGQRVQETHGQFLLVGSTDLQVVDPVEECVAILVDGCPHQLAAAGLRTGELRGADGGHVVTSRTVEVSSPVRRMTYEIWTTSWESIAWTSTDETSIRSARYCCSAPWTRNCNAEASSTLLGAKTSCCSPAPKVGRLTRSPGDGEDQLLDQVADVVVRRRRRGAAPVVDVEREVDVHCAVTRVWVEAIVTGVPFGTQTAWLSTRTSGWPPEVTRGAPVIHCAVTHGVGDPAVTIGQPATTYGAATVVVGMPLTSTRGLGVVGWAWPPWAQSTVAPT